MLSDPITLYKLMILYMLAHVNFPLTNSQLTDFSWTMNTPPTLRCSRP